jgi:predicted ATPase
MHKPNFFVLTGGPGVGKTSVLRYLAGLGELVVEETARAVIRQAVATGGRETPWLDNPAFVAACARRDIAIFDQMAGETRRVFFDRGIIDSYEANGVPPWPALKAAVRTRRYNPTVFLFPPWREIYETDPERRQDWPEAERTFELIRARLPTLGYAPVIVPPGDVAWRAGFMLQTAGARP